jgi:hypothetical protein
LYQVDYKSYLLDFKSLTEDDHSTMERTKSNPVELSSSLDENRILQSPQVRFCETFLVISIIRIFPL